MRVLINSRIYSMTRKQLTGVLNIAKKQIPFGIYAVEKDGVCELRKDVFGSKEELDREVAGYEAEGFRVYKNEHGQK